MSVLDRARDCWVALLYPRRPGAIAIKCRRIRATKLMRWTLIKKPFKRKRSSFMEVGLPVIYT